MSADTLKCPSCGLSQANRHVFCARCDSTLRISTEVAEQAVARARRIAGGLEDLELPPDQGDDPTVVESSAKPPPAPEGPAWIAPGDSVRRSWGMPERSSRSTRRRGGAPTGPDTTDPTPTAGPITSSDGIPAKRPTLSADQLPTARGDDTGKKPSRTPKAPPRGRPPGALYASENRGPDDDPLMAALLDGVRGEESFPSPSERLQSRVQDGAPPIRATDDGAAPAPEVGPGGERVVPPSRGRRRKTTNATRNDPRGRQIAMHPDELDSIRRAAPSPRVGSSEHAPADPGSIADRLKPGSQATDRDEFETPSGPIPAVPTTASQSTRAPGSGDRPLAGYTPSTAGSSPRDRKPELWELPPEVSGGLESRRWIAVGTMLLVLVIGVIGASVGLQRFGNLRAIERVLDAGVTTAGPVPALPKDIDRVLAERGLTERVASRVQSINAAEARFEFRLELRQSLLGIPLSYEVGRDGDCDVSGLLPTADFYRDGGWVFDAELEQRLREYESSGPSEVRKVTSQAAVPLLTEDSRANLPSQSEDEESEAEAEGETPAP